MPRVVAVASLFALVSAACQAPAPGAPASPSAAVSGPVVATVGSDSITLAEFEQHLKEQSPFIRSRYTTLDKKKEFLDSMIRFDLLAEEARRQGFDKDPEVVSTIQKALVQRLIHKRFEEAAATQIPEADLRAYYDAHKDDYVKPERIRLQVVEFKGPEGDRAALTEAKKALVELKAKVAKNDYAAFPNLAASRSDDPATKLRNGDTDYRTFAELSDHYGAQVSAAADKLKAVNEMSDIVRGTGGWFLLRLLGRQSALDRTFEQVRPSLQSRLLHDQRKKEFEDYVKGLRAKAHVTVDDTVLAKAEILPPQLGGNGPPMVTPGFSATPPPIAATPPGRPIILPQNLMHGPRLPPGAVPARPAPGH